MKISSVVIGASIAALAGAEALTLLALYQSENRRYEGMNEMDSVLNNTKTDIDMVAGKVSELEKKLSKLDIDVDMLKVRIFPDAD